MFYDNIYKICTEKGTTPTTVLKELGFSTGNVSKWKKGSIPNVEITLAIARHLGVTMDYLVTGEKAHVGTSVVDPEWIEIISRIPEDRHQMCKDFLRTHMVIPEKYADQKRG
jgi:transcriptional regulator with XRE-family HTH domain